MSSSAFSKAVTEALASSSSFSYGTLIKPDARAVPSVETRGNVPPTMGQWVLQGDDFSTSLTEQYDKVKIGETKLLVAATGIGKTTLLPLKLALMSGKAGLIIMPKELYVARAIKVVTEILDLARQYGAHVDVLRSKYVKNPVKGAAVYYSTAENFLVRFHADRSLPRRLNLDYIYLDEAHSKTPGYIMMEYLVGMQFFTTSKVFYGTATSPGTSMILTGSKFQVKPQPRPSSEFTILNPESTPARSVLNYRNIDRRLLIFLPTDYHISLWEKYYDDHDVRVFVFYSYDSTRKVDKIEASLSDGVPAAFLVTAIFETSLTLSIDGAICCGYTQCMEVDYGVPSVELRIRTVTHAERTQRMGRAGRHLPGVGYYNDVQLSHPSNEMDPSVALYVWMWLRIFRIRIKDPEISQFSQLMDSFSDEAICLLLCSRLHPILVMPYMAHDGSLFKGWEVMKHVFHTDKSIAVSVHSNQEYVDEWPERNTGPQPWLEEPADYKSRSVFPDEWQALPLAAWKAFSTGELNISISLDNVSVVSALVPELPKLKNKSKTVSILSLPETINSKHFSVATVGGSDSPLGDKFLSAVNEEDRDAGDPMLALRQKPVMPAHRRTHSNVTEEIDRNSVAEWVETVDKTRTKHRRSSRKSSSSDGSHDRDLLDLIKVDPYEKRGYKLYPLDSLLHSEYLSSENARDDDFRKFDRLIRVKENFSNLSNVLQDQKEKQVQYFMAVIRVHNNQVMEKLQITASGSTRAAFIDRFFGRDFSVVDVNIKQSALLLRSMQFEGFFVGVDRRTLHTVYRADGGIELSNALQMAKISADYLLHTAERTLAVTVNGLSTSCFSVYNELGVGGTAWKFGHSILMPYHVFMQSVTQNCHQLLFESDELDFVVCKSDTASVEHAKVRGPVNTETVLAVGMDPTTDSFSVFGPMDVLVVGDIWCIDKSLQEGFSGFALVSIVDYAIVGMYLGHYATLSEGKDYAHFIPTNIFLSEIAIGY